jgi:iron complex outermembrane receptor protein
MVRNLILACALLALPATALASAPPDTVLGVWRFPGLEPVVGAIHGTVADADSGDPIVGATVRILELGRAELSHGDGSFHFENLAPGTYTVSATRVGYARAELSVQLADGDTVEVRLLIEPSAIEISGVVVTATGDERSADDVYQPTTVVSGSELRRQLGTSVAATLADEPGISQLYNGPAASQPVIRGLSGDRVLVLEDGQRTGDLASTSPDHAVTIDPITAERIEVVRGAAGVLYGSNALGGVINVIREEVPRTLPERLAVQASTQIESVNRGLTAGAVATAPVGPIAVRAELSGRTAGNTQTPLGELPTTYIDGYNAGAGASWVAPRGYLGVAGRSYAINYGVPGIFNGQVIPGAHEDGVEIDLRRSALRLEGALTGGVGPFESVEMDANYVRFDQEELELGGAEGPVVGTRFRQFTSTAEIVARHRHRAGGVRLRGAAGIWGLSKNFSVAGSRTGTAPADQVSVAGFAFEEFGLAPFRLQFGARYDWTRIAPLEEGNSDIGFVRTRDFGAFSGSAAALYELSPGWTTGVSVSRSFRTPAIEELFSDGPHLANYTYDIGNPELGAEHGLGADLFLRASLPRFTGEISGYRNAISDYIYYDPTGELDPRFDEFPVREASQVDAVLIGFESVAQWEVAPSWVLHGKAGYVRGSREGDDGDVPLPAIPPLHGGFGVRFDLPRYFAGASWEAAAEQNRVPPADPDAAVSDPFIQPTDGHHLFNATAGLRWTLRGRFHTLTMQVDNVFDTAWKDHLSRIKPVAPQPGRNLRLLYRVDL